MYRLTVQTKGKRGWYSHPVTLEKSDDLEPLVNKITYLKERGRKYSVFRYDEDTGKWIRIITKEVK